MTYPREKGGSPADPIDAPPPSACSTLTVFCGLAFFAVAMLLARYFYTLRPTIYIANLTLFVSFLVALGVFIPELLVHKVHRRLRRDDYSLSPSWPRTLTKFMGLLGTLALIAFGYWLIVEYSRSFYERYFFFLKLVLPFWLIVAIPYIRHVDARMKDPEDGLWHMGRLVLFKWHGLRLDLVRQHLMGWLVKAFFLPLMFSSMCNWLTPFLSLDFSALRGAKAFYMTTYDLLYLMDIAFSVGAYLFSLRLMDTHIRSTEPTFLGWGAALICYEPFWQRLGSYLLDWGNLHWTNWLNGYPVLFVIWGCVILVLIAVYAYSTAAFGMRFSNLTHRGIITNGPYRWMKHPAYVCKNLTWWFISVPFVINGSMSETLRHVLLLLMLNGIYFVRAKTEERHLSRDPVYVEYAAWIDKHGLFAILKRGAGRAARRLLAALAKNAEA